jgi:hypothetical protein
MNRLLLATLVTTAGGLSAGSVPDSNGVSASPDSRQQGIDAGSDMVDFASIMQHTASDLNRRIAERRNLGR